MLQRTNWTQPKERNLADALIYVTQDWGGVVDALESFCEGCLVLDERSSRYRQPSLPTVTDTR